MVLWNGIRRLVFPPAEVLYVNQDCCARSIVETKDLFPIGKIWWFVWIFGISWNAFLSAVQLNHISFMASSWPAVNFPLEQRRSRSAEESQTKSAPSARYYQITRCRRHRTNHEKRNGSILSKKYPWYTGNYAIHTGNHGHSAINVPRCQRINIFGIVPSAPEQVHTIFTKACFFRRFSFRKQKYFHFEVSGILCCKRFVNIYLITCKFVVIIYITIDHLIAPLIILATISRDI